MQESLQDVLGSFGNFFTILSLFSWNNQRLIPHFSAFFPLIFPFRFLSFIYRAVSPPLRPFSLLFFALNPLFFPFKCFLSSFSQPLSLVCAFRPCYTILQRSEHYARFFPLPARFGSVLSAVYQPVDRFASGQKSAAATTVLNFLQKQYFFISIVGNSKNIELCGLLPGL